MRFPQRRWHRYLVISSWVILVSVGALVPVVRSAVQSQLQKYTTVATPAALPHDAHQLGPLPTTTSLHLSIALRPRNPSALESVATAIASPGSAQFHHYLTPSMIAERYGPAPSAIKTVTDYVRKLGFIVRGLSSNHLLLSVGASAHTVSTGLHANLRGVRLSGGLIGWRTTSDAILPADVAQDVTAVVGLNNVSSPHAMELASLASARRSNRSGVRFVSADTSSSPSACAGAQLAASAQGGWTDNQIANAYGISSLYAAGDYARGETIAVVELEPFLMSDIAAFDSCYFGKSHTDQVHRIPVDGFHLVGAGSGESVLDIESVSAIAPQATIDVYEADNTTFGTLDDYNEIVSRDSANIVTTSWGECEQMLDGGSPGARQAENYIFEEAAAQGQTFIAATGDSGSDDCATTPFNSPKPVAPYLSVDDPASQPYVLAVGGTTLVSDVQPLNANEETAWNTGSAGGATGGGISSSWASPSWQADSGIQGVSSSANRQVPDVSAAADSERGITVYSTMFQSDHWTTIGGTSESSPLWAGVLAEIAASGPTGTSCNNLASNAGGTELGFVPPLLYGVASSTFASTFHPITIGNNDAFGLGLGYSASPGYNLVGGLGSPIVTNANGQPGLAAGLCNEAATTSPARPVIAGLTPDFGSLAGGTSVAIALAQPIEAGARIDVTFGGVPAKVLTATGALVNVVTPPAALTSGAPSFSGAGPAVVSVTQQFSGESFSSASTSTDLFAFVNESASATRSPTVSEVNPAAGNDRGANTISIFGSGFADGQPTVRIGGRLAVSVRVVNDYHLIVSVPRRSAATKCSLGKGFYPQTLCQTSVVVTTVVGSSPKARVLPEQVGAVRYSALGDIMKMSTREIAPAVTEYDYAPTPTIHAIVPDSAAPAGGITVQIIGQGFSLNTLDWVNFGPARSVSSQQLQISYISPTQITLRVPPHRHLAGKLLPGGVSVQSAAGLSSAAPFRFSPSSG